ncbi:helix-turn-helix domain-containing protein [Streptomyces sennicomposti]|uniref:helix-turn-helix domain-containing protein n=1 Tax=Streptomyces sennicomposti TaxID=2873384 RepID=UPI001CA6BCE5|nr:helix-turn-helix transcriptional regulator [Streptomyces sennicomposti]MBY8870118.1 helix-turn-helix domain-containing protein [Streptomyces sennicomposti]
MAGGEFAELLGELKQRSGLSYGALGKRLHMSASTVHRYVSGDVVPTDYAPVERLARVCRATPEELLELHRRWLRADALRGVKPEAATATGTATGTAPAAAEVREQQPEPAREATSAPEPVANAAPELKPSPAPGPVADAEDTQAEVARTGPEAPTAATAAGEEPVADAPVLDPPKRRKRTALLAGAGVVAVAAATALVVNLVPSDADRSDDGRAAAAAVTAVTASRSSATDGGGRSAGAADGTSSASPSPSHTSSSAPPSRATSAASPSPLSPSGDAARPGAGSGAAPLTVGTTPYYWDLPCEQSFLVDRSPRNVLPPPPQQDVVGWAASMEAVAADHQMVVLTVQGTGAQTVVLKALHVRIVSSGPRLTWNKYAMGDGCGGGVDTKSFDVSLDLGNPLAQPIAGQRDFPYKVSESDPEVFYVNGHTSGHDVRWYLELDWSSGERHGTLRIDDHGKPFRTSGSGPAYYASPLGGHGWELANYS